MAKVAQKNAYTDASKQFDKDKEALSKLGEKANGDKGTAADKAAYKAAKDKLDADGKKLTRLRFRFVGGPRVNKAVSAIKLIKNIANRRQYDFSVTDVEKIKSGLENAVADAIDALQTALNTSHAAPAARDEITFD